MPGPVTPKPIDGSVLSAWEPQGRETVLVAGQPKGAGKTTFALSVTKPGTKTIVIACDLGRLSVPPGVNKDDVLVLPYQNLTREYSRAEGGHSSPVRDVYLKLTGDFYKIYQSVKQGKAIALANGAEFPPPNNIILDGCSRLNAMLVDGQCAMNNIDDPSDLDNKAFKFWGKRMRDTLTIVEQFASLPVNVILTSWIDQVKDSDGKPTGVWQPDIGGKMDLLTAGTVGAAVLAFSLQSQFYIRVRPDGQYPWIGVRDCYSMPSDGKIDVTVTPGKVEPQAWDRVFTKYRNAEKK